MMSRDRVLMFSGGKDSTYLLWYCIENNIKFDRVVFCDTTLKLPIEYHWIDCIEDYFNVNIERKKPKQKFKHKFYQVHKSGKDKGKIWGLPYVSCPCWILRDMKLKNMKDVDGEFLLGYTADENRGLKNVDYDAPLQKAGITAKQVIRELKAANLYPPIYKLLEKWGVRKPRSGCFLCPKAPEKWFEMLYHEFPFYFEKVRMFAEMDDTKLFKPNRSFEDIEKEIAGKTRLKEHGF